MNKYFVQHNISNFIHVFDIIPAFVNIYTEEQNHYKQPHMIRMTTNVSQQLHMSRSVVSEPALCISFSYVECYSYKQKERFPVTFIIGQIFMAKILGLNRMRTSGMPMYSSCGEHLLVVVNRRNKNSPVPQHSIKWSRLTEVNGGFSANYKQTEQLLQHKLQIIES